MISNTGAILTFSSCIFKAQHLVNCLRIHHPMRRNQRETAWREFEGANYKQPVDGHSLQNNCGQSSVLTCLGHRVSMCLEKQYPGCIHEEVLYEISLWICRLSYGECLFKCGWTSQLGQIEHKPTFLEVRKISSYLMAWALHWWCSAEELSQEHGFLWIWNLSHQDQTHHWFSWVHHSPTTDLGISQPPEKCV